ncbi:MAG: AIR synthase family protein [Defluviitaleaceae bacterium]|nr:AIR synthase family protein [Defluviitaleaceae bacterium]
MDKAFEVGKLPVDILSEIIASFDSLKKRDDVLVRPKVGEDCAAISFSDEICLLSTDPITAADKDSGYFAVHINANDIAASGGEPVGVLVTALLPVGTTKKDLKDITSGIYRAADEIGIEVLGGHTEVTDAVNKPILSVAIAGKAPKNGFISTSGAQIGDDVIITKLAALEGTALIADSHYDEILEKFGAELADKAVNFKNLLSVIKDAKIAMQNGANSMHDITEGGVLGACYEVAEAAGLGIEVHLEKVPLADESKKICEHFGADPYYLISSGALLITTKNGEKIVAELKKQGIGGAVIGKIIDKDKRYYKNGESFVLEPPKADEIYRII